jgi:hypothetical protein
MKCKNDPSERMYFFEILDKKSKEVKKDVNSGNDVENTQNASC